jgi:hypothetical protein
MADNIFKASAFLAALKKYGGVEMINGGERIAYPLMYEENSTIASYQGYEQIDVTPQDGMTTAFYEWREVAGTIAISRREERQNSGESAILGLLEKKTMQAEMSLKNSINQMLIQGTVNTATFVPGNSAKDINPLGYFLPKANATDALAGGSVGNINRATYSWWRPITAVFDSASPDSGNSFAVAVTTYAGLKVGLYRMWNYCSRGADGSGPNLIVCNQETYETYENALDAQKQYLDSGLAEMGFDNVKLKGGTLVWDERVPDIDSGTVALTTGSAFFINTKFMKLVIDSETEFATTDFVTPENQTAKVAKVLFMGQLCSSNMRKHGVAYAISKTITS